jgi:hypothetical protein
MSSRHGDRLVVEEQDREVMGLPLRQPPVLVLQRADDPERATMQPHHPRLLADAVVHDATIAQPRSALRDRDDLPAREHPVLARARRWTRGHGDTLGPAADEIRNLIDTDWAA